MDLGEKLRLRRLKAGYTQEQIANKMNITRQTLSNWEVGKNLPDISSIITLAEIYGLSLDELLLGKIYFRGVLSMHTKRTMDEIHAIIRHHYPTAMNIRELTGGLASQTLAFEANGQQYVFKTGTRKDVYEKEEWVYNKFNHQLPLRRVIEIHNSGESPPYAIYDFIEGIKLFDLDDQGLFDIVHSVLHVLSSMQSIDVSDTTGYGRFDGTGKASFASWLDYIEAIYNEKIYDWSQAEKKGLDPEVIAVSIQKLKVGVSSININEKHLIHGDLGSFNLIADRGNVVGMIDWSLAMYGDHLYDIANILFWNEEKLQQLIAHLKANYLTNFENKRIIACYMLRIGLEEVYNTVILNEPGYDIDWVVNRLKSIEITMDV